MKKAVVTGGAGFIGSHLTDQLLGGGYRVTVVDNLATGRMENLREAAKHPRFDFIKLDINDASGCEKALKGTDTLFHLAALADIVPSIERPMDYFRSNVIGTANILEAARAHSVGRVVYAASSSCYGIPDIYPTPETAPAKPQYPYALTKYLGEQMVLHWAAAYRMNAVSLRFFNVYGPRARTSGTYGAVFGVFLAQKLSGSPLTIVGDGSQTRDFTYVTDVVGAIVRAAESQLSGCALNVGSGKTVSVNTIADLLGGEKIHIPKRPGEPDCTFADIIRIRTLLGWEPQVGIEQGIRAMLEHIEDWRQAPVWTPEKIATATEAWFRYLTPKDSGRGLP